MWHFMTTPVPDSTVAKETTGKIFTTTVNTTTPTTQVPTTQAERERFHKKTECWIGKLKNPLSLGGDEKRRLKNFIFASLKQEINF